MLKVNILVFSVLFSVIAAQVQFRVIRQWKYLNYTWPNEETLQAAIANGGYIPENVITAGIMHHDGWYYLTMPRMKQGVPATLGRVVSTPGGSTAPLISPFPSWDFNKLNDCNALQNVQNVEMDSKGQMWIIDGGHTGSLTDAPVKNCPPKLVIFDIKNNATVSVYTFPESAARQSDSFLYDLVIDNDDFAYITDNSGGDPGLIVFSLKQNRSWKIRHPTMRADREVQNFRVNNVLVSVPINIAGIALGPKIHGTNTGIVVNEDREVFYCPLSSLHLYSISTSVLQNESNSNNGMDYLGKVKDVGIKASQTDGMIMTNHGVLYYGLLGDNSISKWDSLTPFASGQKVVSRDPTYIQWTNAFTMDAEGTITVLSNTLQKFIYEKLDLNEHNFWLLSAQTGEKSYIYEDSSFHYNPINTTEQKATTPDHTMHLYKPSGGHTGRPKTESTTGNSVQTPSPVGAGANQIVMELSVILAAIMAWIVYHN